MTLWLLWQEYRHTEPTDYRYSPFAEHDRRWRMTIDPVMRQAHRAGERTFVDYAGLTVDIFDAATGEIRTAQIFVAALGASSVQCGAAALDVRLCESAAVRTPAPSNGASSVNHVSVKSGQVHLIDPHGCVARRMVALSRLR